MSATDELNKLKKLRDDGTITAEQYERARKKLLDDDDSAADRPEDRDDRAAEDADEREERRPRRRRARADYDDEELSPRARRKKAREWCMLLHLSLFAGHTIPLGGIIAPIVIWQVKKDEMPEVDEHGKNAVNWVLSFLLYALLCVPLVFVIIGIPLLIVLAVLNVVFPIIAAVKANEGRVWKYPLAISFFK